MAGVRTPLPFLLPVVPTAERDLVALGISRRRLAAAAQAGRLLRVRRGVYLDPSRWPEAELGRHLLRAHAEQANLPAAVVSHRSAAGLWGLPLAQASWADEPVWITLPAGAGFRSGRRPELVQHVADLPPHQVTVAPAGFRVTSVARTAADLSAGSDLATSLMVLDSALRLLCADLVSNPRRSDFGNQRLVEAARGPIREAMQRRGMRSAQATLVHASPLRESPIESLTYAQLMLAGLPLPTCQHPIPTPFGIFYPDFYWERQRLIGEADGRVKYGDADAIIAEKEREQVLRDLGFQIVRWTGREIAGQPQLVVGRIARALGV